MHHLLLIAILLLFGPAAAAACPGDCNGDARVDIGELVRGVNIALGNVPASQCPAIDGNGSGSVSISELVAAVSAALSGCPSATPTAVPTATPTGGVEPILPADYAAEFVEVRDCRLSIEHQFRSIRVLANRIAADGYLRDANPLPLGSIVVKEEYDGGDCVPDDLIEWTAMRKEPPGFDGEDADWHWQRITAPGRRVLTDTKDTCIGCHRQPACTARDYMCTVGATRGRLRPVLEDLPGALLSVSGRGPTDVYAVGADPDDDRGPLVVHWDGDDWTRLDTGARGDLWWISTPPIDGDFFLAGAGGLILRFDPDGGGFTRFETPGDEIIYGVWGSAANDVWAVGGDEDAPDTGGTVWRFDGATWTRQDLSGVRAAGLPLLFKVWGRAADDVYAVGRLGVILHWDGTRWTLLNDSGRQLFTVHGNDTLTAAVGGFFAEGLLRERDGDGAFAMRTPSGIPQLNGVFVPPDGRGVAVGNALAVATRADGVWRTIDEGSDELARDFHAVWVDGEDGIWAVGGDLSIDLDDGLLSYGGPQSVSGTLR